jgi:hypothetical protein
MKCKSLIWLTRPALLAVLALLAAPSAWATSMLPLDLKALLKRADRVVLATVISEQSHWTDNHDAIYTDSVVRVDRTYKGGARAGQTVVVRREGGSVDGIGMRVHGSAQLAAGEQALMFLEVRGPATWVVGMSQGKWPISVENGRKVVHGADLSGIELMQPGAIALTGARPLAEVERQLRLEIQRGVQ